MTATRLIASFVLRVFDGAAYAYEVLDLRTGERRAAASAEHLVELLQEAVEVSEREADGEDGEVGDGIA